MCSHQIIIFTLDWAWNSGKIKVMMMWQKAGTTHFHFYCVIHRPIPDGIELTSLSLWELSLTYNLALSTTKTAKLLRRLHKLNSSHFFLLSGYGSFSLKAFHYSLSFLLKHDKLLFCKKERKKQLISISLLMNMNTKN